MEIKKNSVAGICPEKLLIAKLKVKIAIIRLNVLNG